MITGAGHSTDQLKEATHYHCDVYITGEKSLYTVQYAKFLNLNLIVGSHTFTEVYGVQALAIKLKEKCIDIEIVQLEEKHLEAEGITLL
ncbi:Nif3-like dinuclear metal center hexameric protein [Paenibacillus sp. J5C_2022]|uniref:Nif3-like dinuclear metal center hexameric protein n=1 Tax=Paenibacillus sp. J5C2022 TaxID=2977129 RepID=UPI0021D1335E|nr:Nif3-like dinuclear metal center hexameric protein [Paenibacillus sp. J5C2022]MCU6712998.1 Nif3-like dinuclear metal center hexameric protein [Paenibacillus sp. J5C2022]